MRRRRASTAALRWLMPFTAIVVYSCLCAELVHCLVNNVVDKEIKFYEPHNYSWDHAYAPWRLRDTVPLAAWRSAIPPPVEKQYTRDEFKVLTKREAQR